MLVLSTLDAVHLPVVTVEHAPATADHEPSLRQVVVSRPRPVVQLPVQTAPDVVLSQVEGQAASGNTGVKHDASCATALNMREVQELSTTCII